MQTRLNTPNGNEGNIAYGKLLHTNTHMGARTPIAEALREKLNNDDDNNAYHVIIIIFIQLAKVKFTATWNCLEFTPTAFNWANWMKSSGNCRMSSICISFHHIKMKSEAKKNWEINTSNDRLYNPQKQPIFLSKWAHTMLVAVEWMIFVNMLQLVNLICIKERVIRKHW